MARGDADSTVATVEFEPVAPVLIKSKSPFMLVNILDYDFPAFLDTGSPLSFPGCDVIEMLRSKHIQTKACYKKINFLQGSYVCSEENTLTVKYADTSRRQKFYILPGALTTVLLGRDFLSPALISLHVGLGGWSIKPRLITFIPSFRTPQS